MPRTLFVVPIGDVGVFAAGAGRAVAAKERARLVGWLAGAGVTEADAERRLEGLVAAVEAELESGPLTTPELGERIPPLQTRLQVGSGRYTQMVPLGSRVLYQMAMELRIVRAEPAGSWRSSQYRWAGATDWAKHDPNEVDEVEGRDLLLERYLRAFGPATLTDIRWWTGWTLRDVRHSLKSIGAAVVDLESRQDGFVLRGDLETSGVDPTVVSFLFGLDPTVMGWKERDWYLDPRHVSTLFDRNGNAGCTVWIDGRVVGGWGQKADGTVVYSLLDDCLERQDLVAAEADALTTWFDGEVAVPRFKSPLDRRLAAGAP